MTGAILRETVPATIMRSDCLGEARNTPAPKRSRSYREETLAIISIAQQANPNVMGHRADFLAQLTTASRLVVMIFASNFRSNKLTLFPPISHMKCSVDVLHCAHPPSNARFLLFD